VKGVRVIVALPGTSSIDPINDDDDDDNDDDNNNDNNNDDDDNNDDVVFNKITTYGLQKTIFNRPY
jgi:hypothetical protein